MLQEEFYLLLLSSYLLASYINHTRKATRINPNILSINEYVFYFLFGYVQFARYFPCKCLLHQTQKQEVWEQDEHATTCAPKFDQDYGPSDNRCGDGGAHELVEANKHEESRAVDSKLGYSEP